MSLYYEDFPADDGAEPQLPPLLTAVKVPSGQNVMAKALASGATAEVGTVFYGEDTDVTDIARVLGPEVPLRKAGQMRFHFPHTPDRIHLPAFSRLGESLAR